jgi:hypothetical protein
MKFQSIVIIILGILLIITIISFYYIASTPAQVPYPKSIPVCPDYYFQSGVTSSNGSVSCKALPTMEQKLNDVIKTGWQVRACSAPVFPSNYYTGTRANCLKYNWVKSCMSVPAWDGISYGVQNPCATK